jgi:hypothetical protein
MARTITPVGGPAAWRGPELVDTKDWIVSLTSTQAAELTAAAEFAVVGDLDADRSRVIRAAMPTLGPVLAAARRELIDGRGFVVLRGLPVEGVDPLELERRYWCLGVAMGIPVPQTLDGALLVHVRDQGLDYTDPHVRGYQTRARLDYHVDGSDVVGLLCVRAAREGGISTIVSSTALHDEILARRPDLVGLLYEQFWFDRRAGDGPDSFYQLPIFGFELDHFVMYYGRSYIESAQRGPQTNTLSPEQLEAFDLIDALANSPEFLLPMDLRPGDVQLLNNRLTMHARTDYLDWAEPDRKRDMVRLWLSLGDGRPAEMVP